MCNRLFIGIDTSCYMTSIACLLDNKVFQYKKPLVVKDGECGLRQSEALFQHIKNLPVLFDELKKDINISDYKDIYITVSTKPRNVENSYMPVFLAGESYADVISSVLGATLIRTSHQDGHIMAAIFSENKLSMLNEPFISLHLSGGTTEILLCEYKDNGFLCKIVGGTKDLPCGQFIDRIGVLTGRDFPSGKFLDYSAINFHGNIEKRKPCIKEGYMNFSGEETHIRRLYENKKINADEAAYMTMSYISNSVKEAVINIKRIYGVSNVIMAGGVSSSSFLRREFSDVPDVYFASPEFSGDNAVGVCFIGKMHSGVEL